MGKVEAKEGFLAWETDRLAGINESPTNAARTEIVIHRRPRDRTLRYDPSHWCFYFGLLASRFFRLSSASFSRSSFGAISLVKPAWFCVAVQSAICLVSL